MRALELKGIGVRQGEPALLSEARAAGARPRLRRRSTTPAWAGSNRRTTSQIRGRAGKVLIQRDARRQRADEPRRARGDRRRDARADDRSVPAEHRRARAAGRCRASTARPAARVVDHGSDDRRDPRARQRPDVQPQRLLARAPSRTAATARSRISTSPDRRSRSSPPSAALEEGLITPDDPIDVSAGFIRFGSRVDRRRAPLRRAVVHRRHRQVEQRRRDQGRPQARPRAARPLRQPLRLRPDARARLPRREPRHRLESGQARCRARWRRCRWAIRSA